MSDLERIAAASHSYRPRSASQARSGTKKWLVLIAILLIPVALLATLILFGVGWSVFQGNKVTSEARRTAAQLECASKLRIIGQALSMYGNQSRDPKHPLPDTLPGLASAQDLSVSDLRCPISGDQYVYLGRGKTSEALWADFVVAYEPVNDKEGGAHFLFGDGHVDFADAAQATQLIGKLEAGKNPPSY